MSESIRTSKQEDKTERTMSPLADPVINAIFTSEKNAGLAAASLIRAVLEEEGANRKIGNVISIVPQRTHSAPNQRGSRIDIEIKSDKNEITIVDVQISRDRTIMQRNLFTSSHIYTEASNAGDTAAEMAAKLPTVIAINILVETVRDDNEDVLQPFKVMYTKPPQREALPQFSGYNIQLSMLPRMKPDFTNGFYCWFYTLYKAHKEEKTIGEVLEMTPDLQTYARQDAGYQQFCNQYNLVASDPATRKEYHQWILLNMKIRGERETFEEDTRNKFQAEGRAEGRAEVALNLKSLKTMSNENIAKATGLTIAEIEEL